ncbi:MAG: 4Fe-4S dicluster domain-containing protein [Planctomycetes bacterium]|nr:4Fe-4S dicluster domain-containing protein [Planctomycetota bacterium]
MQAQDWSPLVEYTRSLDCIHCGLCLETCPTYRLTGRESASPRGRVHLMRALGEGRIEPDKGFLDEMDGCLVCRRCESVCPAGVEFGAMMGHTRGGLEPLRGVAPKRRLLRWLGFRALLPHRWALGAAVATTRLLQRSGLMNLVGPLMPKDFPPPGELPTIPPAHARRRLPTNTPAAAELERAILLEGCLMPALFGDVNRATAATLAALGVTAIAPPRAGCCGSLHAHNGDLVEARRLAKAIIEAYASAELADLPIVVNSAGCGSHMLEYEELFEPDDPWFARAEAFSARVIDFTKFVATRLERASLGAFTRSPQWKDTQRITWDDPCHLCHGQGVRDEPRLLLDGLCSAAGLERVELEDSEGCCGSAGIYSLLEPAAAAEILESKLDALEASGADLLVTANPGCQLQWQTGVRRRGLAVRVVHIAELLGAATSA